MRRDQRLRWLSLAVIATAACNDVPMAPVPAGLVLVQAPSIAGVPGWELLDTLKVRAVNPDGTPRADVAVTWSVREGGGSLDPVHDTTDANGLASAVWTLGAVSGVNKARASTLEDAQVDFASTGEAFRVDYLTSGDWMGCGLVAEELWCWAGWSRTPPPSRYPFRTYGAFSPGLVDDTDRFVDLAVSAMVVCGLLPTSDVLCASSLQQQMQAVPGLPAMRLVVGASTGDPAGSFCGLASADSTAWCWQGGEAPTQIPGTSGFTRLWVDRAAYTSTTCGLLADSTAACWGDGPLGDGTIGASASPVTVTGGHKFAELAIGTRFACGRTSDGEVWCWGKERYGTGADVSLPTLIATGARDIAATRDEAMLLGDNQRLFRWVGAGGVLTAQTQGLEGLLIAGFSSDNSLSCVRVVDGQINCYKEYWDATSSFPTNSYVPVQPLRSVPVGASSH